ncbi:MAG TPA: FkbM family methyltransferase [Xanthobacteraceae bacterium]|nr:FkbM family methyltransferase [Xanthobacteraceae bacterium]
MSSANLHIAHRRPFAGKLTTSIRKRRVALARAAGPLLGRDLSNFHCRYGGADFIVDLADLVGYEIAIGRMEWREIALMIDACRRLAPDVFLDVGANIGLYSCVLGRRRLVPKIMAFEPDRRNCASLRRNLALNDLLGTAEVFEAAVGAGPGRATLVPAGDDNRGMSKIGTAGPDAYDVEVVALDDVIRLEGRPIVVKVDVEGYEQQVLAGAARLFAYNRGFAQIEARDDDLARAVIDRMTSFGWRFLERYGLDVRFERP